MTALDVCKGKIILELTHIKLWRLVAETGVLREHDLHSLWRVDYPLSEGISGDAEAILPKLGDREKVCNATLIKQNFKNS